MTILQKYYRRIDCHEKNQSIFFYFPDVHLEKVINYNL